MNELFLIGIIHEVNQAHDKDYTFTLQVKRNYKEGVSEFKSDYLPCKIWKGAMDVMKENCKVGDIVALKARLETSSNGSIIIIVEKIRFLYKDNKVIKE